MPVVRRAFWGALPLLLIAIAGALTASALGRGVLPNPANDPRLIDRPMDEARYDFAKGCRSSVPSGMKALESWLTENVRGSAWGITRCEKLSEENWSVHSESRAIDWHLDAGIARDRRAAERFIDALLATDRNGEPNALARRMGIQGLIFNCRAWWGHGEEMGRYSYCFKRNGDRRDDLNRTLAHKDHIHIELNWPGARERTSFWRSPVAR